MANIGDTVTLGQNAFTGSAPGQSTWNVSGQSAKVKGFRTVNGQQYVDLDFTASGGGTGWAPLSAIGGSSTAPASTSTTTPAPSTGASYGSIIQNTNKQLTDIAAKQAADSAAMQAKNEAERKAALDAYTNAVNSLPKLSDLYNQFSEQTGYGALGQNVAQMGDTIRNLPTTVNNSLSANGSTLTKSQIDSAIASRLEKLNPQYQDLLSRQSQLGSQLQTQLGFAQQEQVNALKPFEAGLSAADVTAAQRIAQFNNDQQNQLSILLQKLSTEQSLSLAEIERIQDLADREDTYQKQLNLAKINAKATVDAARAGSYFPQANTTLGATTTTKPTAKPLTLTPTVDIQGANLGKSLSNGGLSLGNGLGGATSAANDLLSKLTFGGY